MLAALAAAAVALAFSDAADAIPIYSIQGNGASSTLVGQSVTAEGIVTARKSNGYFIQTPDGSVDADPATSEGLFVFTSSAPPAGAAVGNDIDVTGTVTEFVPTADPQSPSFTELTSPGAPSANTAGNPLPSAVPLSATLPDPTAAFDQLERLEGMRVTVSSLTVAAPTAGAINETNASATSNGVFYGTVTGVPRPFREPGIRQPDPPPSGTIPPIPRWDANPELLRVDSDGQAGVSAVDVDTGAVVQDLTGPLDYAFRAYTLLPDGAPSSVTGNGATATPVPAPDPGETTVASYNLGRFYNDVDDAGADPVLTNAAFERRLDKASLAIRDVLRSPDVIGMQEVESVATLQALATRVNNDAVADGDPDPQYQAHLVEGPDAGGIDVGFLVKGATVAVDSVTQENAGALLVQPDSSTALVWDRPPLRLQATVSKPGRQPAAISVVVTHLRSQTDIDSTAPGSNGYPTTGHRVRAKRRAQAENLANLLQARQAADPSERLLVLGGFEAFEFNDGMVDVLGTVTGDPPPANETVEPTATDLVDPNLSNLVETLPAAQRYSTTIDGNAAALDHVLANSTVSGDISGFAFGRANADFRQTLLGDDTRAERIGSRDMPVAYLFLPEPGSLGFSAAGYSVAENGGTATVTVQRSGGDTGAVSVAYSTADGSATAGSDYTTASGQLDFADGDTEETFSVPIADDAADEPDENLSLTLSAPTGGASLSSQSTAQLTIMDDDAPAGGGTPPGETPPAVTPPDVSAPVFALLGSRLAMNRRGRVPLRVSCSQAEPEPCSGSIAVATAERVAVRAAAKRRKRIVRLGRVRFSVAPGATRTVVLRLSRRNRRIVSRLRRVKVVATATAVDSAGNKGESKRTYTLRAARR